MQVRSEKQKTLNYFKFGDSSDVQLEIALTYCFHQFKKDRKKTKKKQFLIQMGDEMKAVTEKRAEIFTMQSSEDQKNRFPSSFHLLPSQYEQSKPEV